MAVLTKGDVKRTLFKMALPMLAGTFAMNAYNLTDTWFVSRLGKLQLAAMGFTFPVVMLLGCLAGGLGMGVTALVSHAIGRSCKKEAARITTHGFIMVLCITLAVTIAGFFTVEPLFTLMGADEKTLPLIGDYMLIWYAGSIFMTLPMVGNGILISCGDSKNASRLMIIGTLLNTALDPIFIFGFAGIPAMGMKGAALATVIAQAVSTLWLCSKLYGTHKLLTFGKDAMLNFVNSLRQVLKIGVPCIMSMIMMPVSSSIMTRIISSYGTDAVAATGAAGRIEMFAFVIPMALGISLSPFVSQNYGAGEIGRVQQTIRISCAFALIYGLFIASAFCVFAPQLAAVFTDDQNVRQILISYIRTISFGYGLMEIHRYSANILTGMHKPSLSMAINALRVFALLIPLALLGGYFWGINGVFRGRLAADLCAGVIGFLLVSATVRRLRRQQEEL